MTATSQRLNHPLRDWRAVWADRLAHDLCNICSGHCYIVVRQVPYGEIYEPCPECCRVGED